MSKSARRYPKWRIDLYLAGAAERRARANRERDPGVIRDFPPHVFDDPVAREGRNIVENDAIQRERRA